jgi:hypothetical protein
MNKSPIFVGGAGRSGTTLIRVILDSHPAIACGPELKVIPMMASLWQNFVTANSKAMQQYYLLPGDINNIFNKAITSLLEKYWRNSGKSRIAEKSPNNIFFFQHLHHIFPESPLIHVIRDGRDVVASLLKLNWINTATGQPIDYTQDPKKAAEYWLKAVQTGRQTMFDSEIRKKYFEIHYEDVINDTEPTLKKLFEFLGEKWDPVVMEFHNKERNLADESSAEAVSQPLYKTSVGRWKTDLKEEHKAPVKEVAGQTLIDLGYAKDMDW